MKLITNLIVNITGRILWPFNEHKNLHFDNESDIRMSSENYEKSGNDVQYPSRTWSRVIYALRSGLVGKKNDHLRRTSLGYYPRAPTPWQPLQDWQTISRNNHGLETWSFTRELRTKFTSCAESHSQLVHEWPSSQSNLVRYSLVVSFTISIAVFLKVSVIWDLEWGRGCESESLQHGLTHCSR